MLRSVPYITLCVRNFEETLAFYRDVLGLPVEDQVPDPEGYYVELAGPPKPGEPIVPE